MSAPAPRDEPAAPPASPDAADLAGFGYREQLDRTLGGFSSFAAGFSYLSILTGLPQLFYLGFGAAGPGFFWTWPAVFAGQMMVALCFAELAAEIPLSGGVYPWAKRSGSGRGPFGWMAGWAALACATVSIASVALALQGALPRIFGGFHLIGDPGDPVDAARNAVLLGVGLIALSTAINVGGVRLLARINNVGVFAEIVGVVLLIGLLFLHARRGPSVVMDFWGFATSDPRAWLGALLMAALAPSFVMYGFDTAGSLAEETRDPRRMAPRAILGALCSVGLLGALLILASVMAAPDLDSPALGRAGGGMQAIIRDALGPVWGRLLLVDIVVAVVVCTLTVQASAVRLVFAMARDGLLPFSAFFASTRGAIPTPRGAALVLGLAASALLLAYVGQPSIIEAMSSVAIVWANLGYLFVTAPRLARRFRDRGAPRPSGRFSLGRWGLPINAFAVIWGIIVVINVSWPRGSIYGDWPRPLAPVVSTLTLLGLGAIYYRWFHRQAPGEVGAPAGPDRGEQGMIGNDGAAVDFEGEGGQASRPAKVPQKPNQVAAAWFVHFYTAIGLIFAAWIAVLLVRGTADAFRMAFLLMVAASLVDATDGTLARRFRVKSVLPGFDGRKLDDLTDFLTYTCLPLLLVWRAGLFPEGYEPWLLLPLLASAYGFCQVEAKTEDGYFLGFPSLWNVVALYLYVLQLPPWVTFGIVVVLALMTFVPTRYLYMSLPGKLNAFCNIIGTPWILLLVVILLRLPRDSFLSPGDLTWWLAVASLYFPAFYLIASWVVSFRLRHVPVA